MPLSTGLHLGLSMVFRAAIIGAALMLFFFLFIFYDCSARGFQRDVKYSTWHSSGTL
jgi:hypothetical protein